jgi:hypothetical protein
MPKIRDLGINVIPETMRPPEMGAGGGCGCTNLTNPCLGWTAPPCDPMSCGVSPAAQAPHGCTYLSYCTIAGGTQCGCTHLSYCGVVTACTIVGASHCGCTHFSLCGFGTACGHVSFCGPASCGCTHFSFCPGGSHPVSLQCGEGGISLDQIKQLRQQLQDQLTQLDEHAKSLGPKTAQELDAREKEITEELASLKARRKELK